MALSFPTLETVHDRIVMEQGELSVLMKQYVEGREAERAHRALIDSDLHPKDACESDDRLKDIEAMMVALGYELSVRASINMILKCYAQQCRTSLDRLSLPHSRDVDLYVIYSITMFFEFVHAMSLKMDETYDLPRIPAAHRIILEARAFIRNIPANHALEMLQRQAST